uniref:Uncharacterized protein n=1 Tax=Aegilops tauschii TaxID=37682 RepID=M8B5Q5_AEGTA
MPAELCVFNSGTRKWKIIRKPQLQDQSNGGHFFDLRSIHHVLAFDSRFLCWVDYFSGVLLCDFSTIDSPRSASCHSLERMTTITRYESKATTRRDTEACPSAKLPERKRQQQTGQRITIWTLSSEFQWELHRVINLDCLWAQRGYEALGIPQRFPEFPFVSPDDPDVLCCLLREEEFRGKAWTIMVDMNHAYLRSCTPYCIKCADAECGGCVDDRYRFPPYVELLPTVFSKYLESPTTSKERKKKRKRKANRHT